MGVIENWARIDAQLEGLRSRLPGPADAELLNRGREIARNALSAYQYVTPQLIEDISAASEIFRKLYDRLDDKTEIGSKARLNEAVFIADAGFPERAIFLSGIASEKKMKEPYRTQMANLPAHACLHRFSQLYTIREALIEQDDGGQLSSLRTLVTQMMLSYAEQHAFFARFAFSLNESHILSRYHYSCTYVLRGLFAQTSREATELSRVAQDCIAGITLPSHRQDNHYMFINYCERISDEFSHFPWAGRFQEFCIALNRLRADALEARRMGRVITPAEYVTPWPWLARGAKLNSLVGLFLITGVMAGASNDDLVGFVRDIWSWFSSKLISLLDSAVAPDILTSYSDASVGLSSTGGLASSGGLSTSITAASSGGLAATDLMTGVVRGVTYLA